MVIVVWGIASLKHPIKILARSTVQAFQEPSVGVPNSICVSD